MDAHAAVQVCACCAIVASRRGDKTPGLMTSLSSEQGAAGQALSVRWLADLCGLPPIALLPTLASTLLASPDTARRAADYVAWWIRHPDPGSSFERATRHLMDQPDDALIKTLRGMDYDGLLYRQDGKVVWHAFFQRHGADLCAFSCSVGTGNRRGKEWATIGADFAAFASALAGVRRARWGSGNHAITRQFLALLEPHAAKLGWRVLADGWIHFSP